MGRVFGVDGLPRADGGLGEAAGLGDAGLPLAGAGDDGRLDKGLGLEGWRGFGFFLKWIIPSARLCLIHYNAYSFTPRLK